MSIGVILFAITQGRLPFYDEHILKLFEMITTESFKLNQGTPPELEDLLNHMLDKNPESRITIDGIIHHPWFHERHCPYWQKEMYRH